MIDWIIAYLAIGFFLGIALCLKAHNEKEKYPIWAFALAILGAMLLWPGLVIYRYI